MKTMFVVLTATLFSINAHASFLSEDCSNARGTLQISDGHQANEVTYTVQNEQGETTREKLQLFDLDQEILAEKVVLKENKRSCRAGDETGYAVARKNTIRKVRITKKDGSDFANALARSIDGKALEATVYCEWMVSNIIPCK